MTINNENKTSTYIPYQ